MFDNREKFVDIFDHSPVYSLSSPGRVSLVGIHVDYFGGITATIGSDNMRMNALIRPREDGKTRFVSLNIDDDYPKILSSSKSTSFQPLQYVQAAREVYAKKNNKHPQGFDILINSSIPIGGGLSSSSALSLISIASFSLVNGFLTDGGKSLESDQIVKLIHGQSKKAETFLQTVGDLAGEAEWLYGTKGGKMDQFTLSLTRKDNAFILDNRNYSYKYLSWPKDCSIVVCDTGVSHNQKKSKYNLRKEQAEKALPVLRSKLESKKINSFRDVSLKELDSVKGELSESTYLRASHAVTEMAVRTPMFIQAIKEKDCKKIGEIMDSTYLSLKDNYNVSCRELDIMHDLASAQKGFLGAVISGGGFGGCLAVLVKTENKDQFITNIGEQYNNHSHTSSFGLKGKFSLLIPGRGLDIKKIL